jgi:hypothetical protein
VEGLVVVVVVVVTLAVVVVVVAVVVVALAVVVGRTLKSPKKTSHAVVAPKAFAR